MNTAHGIQSAAWLLVALPLLSAAVLLIAGRRADKWAHLLGAAVPVVLFGYAATEHFYEIGTPRRSRRRARF